MRRVLAPLLLTLLAALLAPARAAAAIPPFPLPKEPDTVRLERLSGPSFLKVPPACYARECALVIVSHPRGQSAERLKNSPHAEVLVQALLSAPFAVLLSDDGGENTWGSPAALAQVASLQKEAVSNFAWNGRTYALGLSMGGLLALRSALPRSPYAVSGVALIDGWTDLHGAWNSATSRRAEIDAAYALQGAPTPSLDPLHLAAEARPLPLFILASPDDRVVPIQTNGERLFAHAEPGISEFVRVSGPHLGGNRFSAAVARQIAAFFTRLELRTDEWARRR